MYAILSLLLEVRATACDICTPDDRPGLQRAFTMAEREALAGDMRRALMIIQGLDPVRGAIACEVYQHVVSAS